MKIYTKTGDQGETGLLGGVRVSKTHLAVEVCGCLDETNSFLGVAASLKLPENLRSVLTQIQNDLFDLGSRVAACESETNRAAQFPSARHRQLEQWIDQFQADLPELTAFILPGGNQGAAMLHLARSICRRTERRLVELLETLSATVENEEQSDRPPGNVANLAKQDFSLELIYLNRLGDLLFVLARYTNWKEGTEETQWKVTRCRS